MSAERALSLLDRISKAGFVNLPLGVDGERVLVDCYKNDATFADGIMLKRELSAFGAKLVETTQDNLPPIQESTNSHR